MSKTKVRNNSLYVVIDSSIVEIFIIGLKYPTLAVFPIKIPNPRVTIDLPLLFQVAMYTAFYSFHF
jgi:hypothetical protein